MVLTLRHFIIALLLTLAPCFLWAQDIVQKVELKSAQFKSNSERFDSSEVAIFKGHNLDSIKIMLYDVNHEYMFTHTSCSDLIYLSGTDYEKLGYDECYCDFVIKEKDKLKTFEHLVMKLEPEESLEYKDFLRLYLRALIKLYYNDSITLLAGDPKLSKVFYSKDWTYRKSRRLSKKVLDEIKYRYYNKDCGRCPDAN